ncbi:IPExxxVDY family protein [Pararhodonellum marinum]|uniref:IPExxxVDY family protein n=1 Tax=Pararhodonellum marinum TaxID=2755358 RepID=UPI00188DFD86|nr:IPExxxVDY family protein [Pararhodonellum marinum]
MKKTKLLVEHHYEFELLGIVAPLKDYKMAWVINNSLGVKLTKSRDFELEFLNQPNLLISQFALEKEHGFIQLLRNRSLSPVDQALYLVPELKIMDYFLLLQDMTFEMNINTYIEALSDNQYIQNVVKLEVSKLKSKENLLTY